MQDPQVGPDHGQPLQPGGHEADLQAGTAAARHHPGHAFDCPHFAVGTRAFIAHRQPVAQRLVDRPRLTLAGAFERRRQTGLLMPGSGITHQIDMRHRRQCVGELRVVGRVAARQQAVDQRCGDAQHGGSGGGVDAAAPAFGQHRPGHRQQAQQQLRRAAGHRLRRVVAARGRMAVAAAATAQRPHQGGTGQRHAAGLEQQRTGRHCLLQPLAEALHLAMQPLLARDQPLLGQADAGVQVDVGRQVVRRGGCRTLRQPTRRRRAGRWRGGHGGHGGHGGLSAPRAPPACPVPVRRPTRPAGFRARCCAAWRSIRRTSGATDRPARRATRWHWPCCPAGAAVVA